MSAAQESLMGSVRIDGRLFFSRFENEEEEEACHIVYSLDTASTRYNIEIGPVDKTKIMTKNLMAFKVR